MLRPVTTVIPLILLAFAFASQADAQRVRMAIDIDAAARKALVKGRFEDGFKPEAGRALTFRRSVAGNDELGKRIGVPSLGGVAGNAVEAVRTMPHQFVASDEYAAFEYVVDLTPAADRRAAAHASWLAADGGVLMLDDLLPLFGGDRKRRRATVALKLPDGWRSFSSDNSGGKDFFDVRGLEGAVIFVGSRFRDAKVRTRTGFVSLLLDGGWGFADDDAGKAAAAIYDAYERMLGPLPVDRAVVALIKFPQGGGPGQWEAETRGATVTVASSDVTFKDRSVQQMQEQLRHEIFHLWFPNAVNLTGDYAWFYEGAALYQSLKLGVELKQVRFSDFLDTMSRAISIDRAGGSGGTDWRRSFGPGHYARAMVIAFLLDLQLMRKTDGGSGFGEVLREMMSLHRDPAPAVRAEGEIVARFAIRDILIDHVFNVRPVDAATELEAAGFQVKQQGRTFTVSAAAELTGRQKAILKRLGYN